MPYDEKMEVLSFLGRGLKLNEATDTEELVTELEKVAGKMKVFEMGGNTLGIQAAEALGKALEKHGSLERCLWSDMFTGRLKTEIAPALQHLSTGMMTAQTRLVEIDLSDNAFGPNGVVGVTELLASPSCYTLQILKLNNNGLGHQGCRHLVEALKKGRAASVGAKQPMRLRVFTAGRNRLENFGAGLLSELFGEMGSLEELSLPQNGIGIHGQEGIRQLVDALKNNMNLRLLNLSDNSLTQKGAHAMAGLLPSLSKLEILDLSDCLLRPAGGNALAQALLEDDTTPHLKRLILSGNELNSSAAIELALSLTSKPSMEQLDLNCNELGEEGCANLLETMRSIDKAELLAGLSDDEGSASEKEEDEDDEKEDEDEEDDDKEETAKAPTNAPVTFSFTSGLSKTSQDSCANSSNQFVSLFSNVNISSSPAPSLFGPHTVVSSKPAESQNSSPRNWPESRVFQVFTFVMADPDQETLWSPLATVEAANDADRADEIMCVTKKVVESSQFDIMTTNNELATRAIFKLSLLHAGQCVPSGGLLLSKLLTKSPAITANSILVELGLIKGEDHRHRKPLCSHLTASSAFNTGLKVVRSALESAANSSPQLPADVSLTLWTLLKHRGPTPSKAAGPEDEMEALLATVQRQLGGLDLTTRDDPRCGDKRAD